MATEEERDLMDQIRDLAGKINRHKSRNAGILSSSQPQAPTHFQAPSHRYNPYQHARGTSRFRSRGGYHGGRYPTQHRNRTLVLNGSGTQTPTSSDAGNMSDQSTTWVSRNNGSRQLINSSVYVKESQSRIQAFEGTQRHKLRQQNQRERAQLRAYFATGVGTGFPDSSTNGTTNSYEVEIEGIQFQVTNGGSKLVRVPNQKLDPKATPKTATVAGVKFFRTKRGNFVRDGVVKAYRHLGVIKKVEVPCTFFSTTGIILFPDQEPDRPYATSSCDKGPQCRYTHDPNKVAVCKTFLKNGKCGNGERCDLSHDLTPERTPACLHYAKGNCANPQCSYSHQDLPSGAPVCRAFGIYGFCEKGASCTERHVYECPDFANTGKCTTRGCKLLHRERASVLRQKEEGNSVLDDMSSDGESLASDDVDSDAVEEIFPEDDAEDFDMEEPKEFVSL